MPPKMMKIVLFGSTGMLGRYVKKYLLEHSYDVVCIDRVVFDIESEKWNVLFDLLDEQALSQEEVIINCAGAIPQQGNNPRKFIALNTLFPHELFRWSKRNGSQFIHITTDCVFSGERGDYNECSHHDAKDIYGITKSMGEDARMCIIRTSIIGEETTQKRSLLEWVRGKKGKEIHGFENVLWNGVSCLQLAKIVELVIRTRCFWRGVRHFYSPEYVSKYKLCKIINDIYKLNITIRKKRLPCKNMTLTSLYDFPQGLLIPSIEEQIREQQVFFE